MPIQSIIRHDRRRKPICSICGEPVNLQTATCDEHGKAVHEECYVQKILARKPPVARAA
jgi:predicted amidophosphoribosyltransferase